MRGVSPIIATVVILLITIAIAGVGYSYLSAYWTRTLSGSLAGINGYCTGGNIVNIIIRNDGTGNITLSDVSVMDASNIPVENPAWTDLGGTQSIAELAPGKAGIFSTDCCDGYCKYRFVHAGGVSGMQTIIVECAPKESACPYTNYRNFDPSLYATFSSIGMVSGYKRDANGNNNPILEYRILGSPDWIQAHPPAKILNDGEDKRIAGSVFFLQPDTEYEVKLNYTDPDGVIGEPLIETIRTRAEDFPTGTGNTYHVALGGDDSNPGTPGLPFRTIQHAADTVQPGDTVIIHGGVYREEVTIQYKSGNPGAYILFKSADGENVEMNGSEWGSYAFVLNESNYIILQGLEIHSYSGGINLYNAGNNLIEDNVIHNTSYGIFITNTGSYENLIQGNEIYYTSSGIFSTGGVGNVIRRNIINESSNGIVPSVWSDLTNESYNSEMDIYENIFYENQPGEAIEPEGACINVRIWNNTVLGGNTPVSFAPITVGPVYVIRNAFYNPLWSAVRFQSAGPVYVYHNTVVNKNPGRIALSFSFNDYPGAFISRNNIFESLDNYAISDTIDAPIFKRDFDYDNLYVRSSGDFVRWENINYFSLSEFQTATNQELNGWSVDSGFVDLSQGDLRLNSDSPLIDKGVILPGINDYYSGRAPDIGAYETITEGYCSDGLDNDQDGSTDCDDSDCKLDANCIILGAVAYYRFEENTNDSSGNANHGSLYGNTVLLMDFDEGSGPTADDQTSYGNDGTMTGATWKSSGCQSGSCLEFDGDGDYVEVADDSSLDMTDSITISMWVNPVSIDQYDIFIGKGDGDAPNYMIQYEYGSLYFYIHNGGWIGGTWNTVPSNSQWSHIAVTYDRQNIITYLNGGDSNPTAQTASMIADNNPLYIGNVYNKDYYFNGLIDEVAVYNRTLSEDEIEALYEAGRAKFIEYKPGQAGYGMDFDGIDDYVEVADDPSLNMGAGNFSLSAWFRVTNGSILGKGGIYYYGKRYYIMVRGDGRLKIEIDDDIHKKNLFSNKSIYNDSNWHHVVGVRDGDNLRLYFNGSEDIDSPANASVVGDIDSPRDLYIGAVYNEAGLFEDYLNGTIDEVIIFNRSLSADEISAIYEYQK